jgi:protein phosphatase
MGGHAAGEVASGLVVDSFESLDAAEPLGLLEFEPLLSAINARIREVGTERGTIGMGTTVVGVALISNGSRASAVVFNVGDSRCYQLKGGILRQVTVDHSHVQELIEAGHITENEAAVHPMRNVVTRALGVDPTVRADYTVLDDVNCRLLLCSDGLSGELSEQMIAGVLQQEADPNVAALRLVESVLLGPAPDNITAVVVDVTVSADGSVDDTVPNASIVDAPEITAPRSVASTRALVSNDERPE